MNSFELSAQYFPTTLQQVVYLDKYSRYDWGLGRREAWVETVDRSVAFLRELSRNQLPEADYNFIREEILNLRAMPSMRLLATAGEAARRQNVAIYNCFSGDTEVITRQGVRRLRDLAGTQGEVLTPRGWRSAQFRAFGVQKTQLITLGHWNGGKAGNYRTQVRATANHRWVLRDGTVTTNLKVGDILWSEALPTLEVDPEGLCHGMVFADGTLNRQPNAAYAQIRLCGEKAKYLGVFTEAGMRHSYPPSCNGDPMVYCGRRPEWKQLPASDADAAYLAGFIKGWLLFDGSPAPNGNIKLATTNATAAIWLERNIGAAGLKIISHHIDARPTNYGPRSAPLHTLIVGEGHTAFYRVLAIEEGVEEPVYCPVEPETGTFLLANGQLTGNCSYVTLDSIDSFVEIMLLSMNGTGVGYSVERRYVEQLPVVKPQTGVVEYDIIMDSTQGWCDALRYALECWFNGKDITFSYDLIRPAGAILRVKGGRASGPEPLRAAMDAIRRIILNRQGQQLRPIDAYDIACHIASASISGGVRRSALISLFDVDDQEMLNAKAGDFWNYAPQRMYANNSAVIGDSTSDETIERLLRQMDQNGTGEPGLFNRDGVRRMCPARRADAEFGLNPCGS